MGGLNIKILLIIACIVVVVVLLSLFLEIKLLMMGIPLEAYKIYIYEKIIYSYEKGAYIFQVCENENQDKFYIVHSGPIFGMSKQQHFNSSGEKVCENAFDISDCRDACDYMKCSKHYVACKIIAGNAKIWGEPNEWRLNESHYKANLGKYVAEESDYNIKNCTAITDQKQKEVCLIEVFNNREDLTDTFVCSLLQEKENQEKCKLQIMDNICRDNASLCTVQLCFDLNFSVVSDIDWCKQKIAMVQCETNINSCSFELCNQLNFSNLSELEWCKNILAHVRCYNNVTFCDPLICDNITYESQDEKDNCKLSHIRGICDRRIDNCTLDLCFDLKNESLVQCESEIIYSNCRKNSEKCNIQLCNNMKTSYSFDLCGTELILKMCKTTPSQCSVSWCDDFSFNTQEKKGECIWTVAAYTENYSVCHLIENIYWHNVCMPRANGK